MRVLLGWSSLSRIASRCRDGPGGFAVEAEGGRESVGRAVADIAAIVATTSSYLRRYLFIGMVSKRA
jgi:hypothetical protein